MKSIPLLLVDYYKLVHHEFYDPRIVKLVSYYTPRSSRLPMGDNQTVIMFGLQGFIKEYLIERFEDEFFSVPFDKIEKKMTKFLKSTFVYNEEFINKIKDLHSLGYLPLEIRAIPEGEKACIKCPMVEMSSTDKRFFWIGEFIESMISAYIWKPMIDANVAHWYREIVNEYYDETVDDFVSRDRAMSEFGFRGADSPESGIHSGAAWLTSFRSTATCSAIEYAIQYYNEILKEDEDLVDITDKINKRYDLMLSLNKSVSQREVRIGAIYKEAYEAEKNGVDPINIIFRESGKVYKFVTSNLSYPNYKDSESNIVEVTDDLASGLRSTEHSIMCSSFSIDKDEETFVKKLLTKLAPDKGISMVSDSYDYWNLINSILPKVKSEVLNREGTLYVRGDSGDPVKIVSGYIVIKLKENEAGYYLEITPESLGIPSQYCCAESNGKYYELKNIADNYPDSYCWVPDTNKEIPVHMVKGTVEVLYDIFGGYTNSKGYKVLDDHIRAIYGDSITHNRARMIYEILKRKKFASNNVSLGAGSFSFHAYEGKDGKLYPYTRDTYGAAIKACGGQYIDDDGNLNWMNIFKDPKTCDNTDVPKRSLRGCCAVYLTEADKSGRKCYYLDHDGLTFDEAREDTNNKFVLVFSNGKMSNQTSITEVRNRIYDNKF